MLLTEGITIENEVYNNFVATLIVVMLSTVCLSTYLYVRYVIITEVLQGNNIYFTCTSSSLS